MARTQSEMRGHFSDGKPGKGGLSGLQSDDLERVGLRIVSEVQRMRSLVDQPSLAAGLDSGSASPRAENAPVLASVEGSVLKELSVEQRVHVAASLMLAQEARPLAS